MIPVDLEKLREEMKKEFYDKARTLTPEQLVNYSSGMKTMYDIIANEVEYQSRRQVELFRLAETVGC